MFAFEHFGVVPDILVLAKALGGGMPLGAFIASRDIMISLTENPMLGHITTFGGHPVSCAAGLAALDVLLSGRLAEEALRKEALFRKLLVHPAIREVRGKGLMLAVELKDFETNKRVIDRCINKGVIVDWFLHCGNAMRIAPPLVIDEQAIADACATIIEAINFYDAR